MIIILAKSLWSLWIGKKSALSTRRVKGLTSCAAKTIIDDSGAYDKMKLGFFYFAIIERRVVWGWLESS